MSKKPWEHLRPPVIRPFTSGCWETDRSGARIHLLNVGAGSAMLKIHSQCFCGPALRQLAEFCTDLADQIEKDN